MTTTFLQNPTATGVTVHEKRADARAPRAKCGALVVNAIATTERKVKASGGVPVIYCLRCFPPVRPTPTNVGFAIKPKTGRIRYGKPGNPLRGATPPKVVKLAARDTVAIEDAITHRRAFIGDTFSGGVVHPTGNPTTGLLPDRWVDAFNRDRDEYGFLYVVWSYATPVAWVPCDSDEPTVPSVRYTATTARLQATARQGLARLGTVRTHP